VDADDVPSPSLSTDDGLDAVGIGVAPEAPAARSCLGQADCPWSLGAPLTARSRGQAAVAHGGQVYLFGGTGGAPYLRQQVAEIEPSLTRAVRAYDPATDSWSDKAQMPVGLYVLTAHALGEKIFVFGGYGDQGFDPTVQAYDPSTDTWETREPMPTTRYTFASEVVAGKVIVIGGQGPALGEPTTWAHTIRVEIYDPDAGWSSGAPSPVPISGAASCAFEGRVFAFGGEVSNLTSIYDVETNSWATASPPPVARNGHSCVRVGNAFLLLGGRDTTGTLDLVEAYDPITDTWQTYEPMPTPRHWFGAAAVGDDVYVFGGEQEVPATRSNPSGLLSDVEVLATSLR
jgi:N-acetylneuraminic acid mutarotase